MSSETPDSSVEKVNDTPESAQIEEQQSTILSSSIPPSQGENEDSDYKLEDDSNVVDADVNAQSVNVADESKMAEEQAVHLQPSAIVTDKQYSITAEESKPLSKLEESLQLRDKLESLIRRTAQTKKRCDKLDHDNKYLQEYVGNMMNSGEFLTKRG